MTNMEIASFIYRLWPWLKHLQDTSAPEEAQELMEDAERIFHFFNDLLDPVTRFDLDYRPEEAPASTITQIIVPLDSPLYPLLMEEHKKLEHDWVKDELKPREPPKP